MMTAIIADDESHCRKTLTELITAAGNIRITGEASTTQEAYRLMLDKKPDLAFLDIQMPGESIFHQLKKIPHPPVIVFQTAYSEFAVEAFGVEAADYLLKPVSPERFAQCLKKLERFFKPDNIPAAVYPERIAVKNGGLIQLVSIQEILYILSEGGYSLIHTAQKRLISDHTLQYFEDSLDPLLFFRTSREAIVRMDQIELIEPAFNGAGLIHLKDQTKIALSRRRAQILKNKIQF